MKMTVKVVGPV